MFILALKRQSVPSLALLVLFVVAACGSDDENNTTNPFQPPPDEPPTPVIALVANQASNNVSGYTINNSTGALVPVAGSPFAAGTTPVGIVITPEGMLAYVANQGSNDV